jgi:hypothetical protein
VTRQIPEVALTPEEVQEILAHCGSDALLVGGQALALWAAVYEVTPPPVLAAAISSDADFIGSVQLARKLGHALKSWEFWQPAPDDATPQTAKLTRTMEEGIKQIDFLDGIAGLDTDAVQRRAATITLASGTELRVLHPLDVLESRLQNLRLIAGKRNAAGIAQAHLAVAIGRSFLLRLIEDEVSIRVIFDAVERIGQIATNKALTEVMLDYNVDLLSAVPAERIEQSAFRTKRWPQITQTVAERKRKYQKQRARRCRRR